MASILAVARQDIIERGFWTMENAAVGRSLDELVAHGFRIQTNEGMQLCKTAVFGNDLIRGTIETFFARSELCLYRKFGKTKHTHCIINRTPDLRILAVFVWSSKSRMLLHARSHLYDLHGKNAPNKFLAIENESLNNRDISVVDVGMEHGGLAIVDGRAAWKIQEGTFVLLGFMTQDEVEHWIEMPLPITVRDALSSMTNEKIGANALFFDPDQGRHEEKQSTTQAESSG